MSFGFWRGRTVLVTGHTGFKGAWLSLWLQQLGATVVGFALEPPTRPSLFEQARIGGRIHSILGDVRDLDALRQAFARHRPQIVIHMAAQALVRDSYADPVNTYAVNVMGTVNVLEAARRADGVEAVVVVTSDKCYENRELLWGQRETDPMGGHDPYSSSKGCAELVASAYARSFLTEAGIATATVRAGNVIGGGDWAADRLIPDIVRAFSSASTLTIRYPDSVRPWQHVLEPLSGYLLVAEALATGKIAGGEGFNFGPVDEDARPVRWIVEHMARLWGGNRDWRVTDGARPHEAGMLRLDCAKARNMLGWRPQLALADALEWVVEWYRAAQDGADAAALCARQIERYQERLSA
ncbi:MAG: CDP-glucose 4,6-dehydratase [Magnetospirillum sp.]|nr:CDP-glucose 4,6-dehydratase [Magnetospirillum sp.]